jgi:hypothetical protein
VNDGLHCPRCGGAAFEAAAGLGERFACPSCGTKVRQWVGPLFGRTDLERVGARAVDGSAVCFFHSGRRADSACDACGRYICALCEIPAGTGRLCPACVEEGRSPQAQILVGDSRIRYERLLVVGATLSCIPPFLFVSFLSAPILIYVAVRSARQDHLIPPLLRRRARFFRYLGILIVSLQVIGWLWLALRLAIRLLR